MLAGLKKEAAIFTGILGSGDKPKSGNVPGPFDTVTLMRNERLGEIDSISELMTNADNEKATGYKVQIEIFYENSISTTSQKVFVFLDSRYQVYMYPGWGWYYQVKEGV